MWRPRNDEADRYLTEANKIASRDEYRHLLCYGVYHAAANAAARTALATLRAPDTPTQDRVDALDLLDAARRTLEAVGDADEARLTYLRRFKAKKALITHRGGSSNAARRTPRTATRTAAGPTTRFATDGVARRADKCCPDSDYMRHRSLAGRAQYLFLAIPAARFYLRELHDVVGSKWGGRGVPPLDGTAATVARYIAWPGLRGTVKAASMQPYLSAINGFYRDHGAEPVAQGDLISKVRKGLAASQVEPDPPGVRTDVPARLITRTLRLAKTLREELGPTWTRD
eukprot:jgi/Tetstr1/460538/TSEL_005796.t1